jgi:hypothetical protein
MFSTIYIPPHHAWSFSPVPNVPNMPKASLAARTTPAHRTPPTGAKKARHSELRRAFQQRFAS